MAESRLKNHPGGEKKNTESEYLKNSVAVDTYGGRVHIEWDHATSVTPMGQLPFFMALFRNLWVFLDHNHFSRSIKKATYPQSRQMYARGNEIPTVLSVHFSCQFCYLSPKFLSFYPA